MKIVQIYRDGTMDDIKIKMNNRSPLTLLNKSSKTQGNNSLQKLYTWNYENDKIICYGWYDGEIGLENKHKLAPSGFSSFLDEDSSTQVLFGDIFIVCMEKGKYIDFDVSGYGEIFSIFCGGFDDCNTSDDDGSDESDEPNTDDEDFIVNDEEEEIMFDEDDTDYSEEELEEDLNDY